MNLFFATGKRRIKEKGPINLEGDDGNEKNATLKSRDLANTR